MHIIKFMYKGEILWYRAFINDLDIFYSTNKKFRAKRVGIEGLVDYSYFIDVK